MAGAAPGKRQRLRQLESAADPAPARRRAEPRLFASAAPGGAHRPARWICAPIADAALAADADGAAVRRRDAAVRGPARARRGRRRPRRRVRRGRSTRWCAEAGFVTEFEHLHPWQARIELLDADGAATPTARSSTPTSRSDAERLWRESFTHACRKNINRARREGVRVYRGHQPRPTRASCTGSTSTTMERRGALDALPRPRRATSPPSSSGCPTTPASCSPSTTARVVAATLYLHDDDDAYSYLGRCRPRLPARAPDERRRRRDDPVGAGAGHRAARARRRLRDPTTDPALQDELLAAAGASSASTGVCTCRTRTTTLSRRVARGHSGRSRAGYLPAVPGAWPAHVGRR